MLIISHSNKFNNGFLMRKLLLQFNLLALAVVVLMAGALVGANLLERPRLSKVSPAGVLPIQVGVAPNKVVYGWPFDAAVQHWGELGSNRIWSPIILFYPQIISNFIICLTVLLTGFYAVDWLERMKGGAVAGAASRRVRTLVGVSTVLVLSANFQRPLHTRFGELVGVCWGWPQPFIQSSSDNKIFLFSSFSLLADLVFALAALGLAARLGCWVFTRTFNSRLGDGKI